MKIVERDDSSYHLPIGLQTSHFPLKNYLEKASNPNNLSKDFLESWLRFTSSSIKNRYDFLTPKYLTLSKHLSFHYTLNDCKKFF